MLGGVFGPGLVDSGVDRLKATPAVESVEPIRPLGSARSSSARYDLWAAALDIHAAEPLHGVGPGTFEFAWNRSPHYNHFVRDAHSFYLESLAEEGWPGLAAGLLLLGGLLGGAAVLRVRVREHPADAGYVGTLLAGFVVFLAYAAFDWMWEETAVGRARRSSPCRSRCRPGAGRATARREWRCVSPLACVALIAGLTQLPGLVSTAKIRSSQQAVQRGDLSTAEVDAEDAVATAPWAASPYVHRALLLERSGRLSAARTDILRAIEREPTNYRHPLLLARIEALRGRVRAALTAFRVGTQARAEEGHRGRRPEGVGAQRRAVSPTAAGPAPGRARASRPAGPPWPAPSARSPRDRRPGAR